MSNEMKTRAEAFDQIVAARKKHIDAVSAYNARRDLANAERMRGSWAIKLDEEYRAMWETQSELQRIVQDRTDAALSRLDAGEVCVPVGRADVLTPVVTGQMEIEPDVTAADLGVNAEPSDDDEETYQIGVRDGYSQAVQEIDRLTGGDGEYRYCTDHDPDRHTPGPAEMIQRIVDRFQVLNLLDDATKAGRDQEWGITPDTPSDNLQSGEERK